MDIFSGRYHCVLIDELVRLPSRLQSRRARSGALARSLTDALNKLDMAGHELVTTYRGTCGTIFIFRKREAAPQRADGDDV